MLYRFFSKTICDKSDLCFWSREGRVTPESTKLTPNQQKNSIFSENRFLVLFKICNKVYVKFEVNLCNNFHSFTKHDSLIIFLSVSTASGHSSIYGNKIFFNEYVYFKWPQRSVQKILKLFSKVFLADLKQIAFIAL